MKERQAEQANENRFIGFFLYLSFQPLSNFYFVLHLFFLFFCIFFNDQTFVPTRKFWISAFLHVEKKRAAIIW